ncbi:HNH endonuclease signature motif containing protein [Corynebacterium sp. AOP40-9SA-29]|uniref:HNH endonuclease signature motif containing protein n=1 Tax=Corynebacterium sp. AOP40-9SA-29 TaxID=3457677 RepID=UPI00403376A9
MRQLDILSNELMAPDGHRPHWAIEVDITPTVRAARRMNLAMLELARASTPEDGADVTDHYSRLQAQAAITRGRAETFCDVGLLCLRMPRLSVHLGGGMLGYDHLRVLARAADGITQDDPNLLAAVETALIKVLTPRRDEQAMPGPRALYNRIAKAIEDVDEFARPLDPNATPAADRPPRRVSVDAYDHETTAITAVLPAAEAEEFLTILDAVCRDRDCSRADAVMHLARGTAEVKVTLNLYREITSETAATDSGHWLDAMATEQFMERVTHLRVAGHDQVEAYVPTAQIRAFVRGRDGTCRFPGCDVAAPRCDLDHVQRYDHDDPAAGGPTDTRNLQCLCRAHHLLKTLGWWDPTIASDGTVMWTSVDDGHSHITEPTGPLAGYARTTFAERASRRYAVVREHNSGGFHDDGAEVPF